MNDIWRIYLIGISLISFVLMGVDKFQAIRGRWRISEKTMHLFSLFGGVWGTIFAMGVFRHKIRKRGFILITGLIVIFQLVLLYSKIELMLL